MGNIRISQGRGNHFSIENRKIEEPKPIKSNYGRNSGGMCDNKIESGLPAGYLEDGYFIQNGKDKVLKKEYIIKYPKEIARRLSINDKLNKRTQIRKFYEFTLRVRELMTRTKCGFKNVEAEFCRLETFANYALSRKVVSPLFLMFIEKNIDAMKSDEDLIAFCKHFEAIIAYMKEK